MFTTDGLCVCSLRDTALSLSFLFYDMRIVIPALLLHGVLVEENTIKWLTAL